MLTIYFHPLWHFAFETLAYFVGFQIYSYLRKNDSFSSSERNSLLVACILGAAFGSKLIVWLENPSLGVKALVEGKGIVGGLIGGWIAVELAKKLLKIKRSTGDIVVLPLITGIAIGRIGCFLTGYHDKTYGNPSNLPWAVNFGDGLLRHPTQLYEIIFLIFLGLLIIWLRKKTLEEGLQFKIFICAYLLFRFFVQFIKPTPAIYFGLDIIQVVALMVLCFYGYYFAFKQKT